MSARALKSTGRERPAEISEVGVRVARQTDREFVVSLILRSLAFGLPTWRDPQRMLAAEIDRIGSVLASPRTDAVVMIAEDDHGAPHGFIRVHAATDCHTHERHGHVAQIAVAHGPHELAAGQALITAAEEWTRARGYRVLTLSEFWPNHPARQRCKQLGFVEEVVGYRKSIR